MRSKKSVIGFMNYSAGKGMVMDDEPCEFFDDCPQIMTPYEANLKLLAGGEASELRHRATYYDKEEFDAWKDEYACDYIQRYNDYMVLKASKFKQQQDEPVDKATSTKKSTSTSSEEASAEAPQEEPLPDKGK